MSSSFPQRNYYALSPYQQRASLGAYQVPMRLSQGLAAPNNSSFNNRPPMGQSPQSSQQTSGQASGNSPWPLVAGGAALAGAVYLGYQWLNKPRAVETTETAEAIEHSSEETVAEGTAKSEAAVVAKEAATGTSAVSSSVSTEGSKLAKAAEGAVGAVEKEVSEVVKKGVEKAPSMMSRISNALSHKAVMIPMGLAAAAAAEYAYPVARPLMRTYGPVAMEYAAKSPALAADLWQGARQSIGNALLNLRYSGATTCAVPAKETLQSLSQAVCKPGEEPLTHLAGQQVSRLWNYGAASLSALGTGISGWFGSTAAKEGAEKLGQCSANVLESSAKNLGQCSLEEAPSYVSQTLTQGGQYLSGLFGSAVEGAKNLVGGAGSEVAPEIVSSGKSAASNLICPVPTNPLASLATNATNFTSPVSSLVGQTSKLTSSLVGEAANLTCPVPSNPLASLATNATNFTSPIVPLVEQATKTAKSVTSTTIPAANNGSSLFAGWFDWLKPTPKLPLEPVSLPQNVSSLSNVTDLVTGTSKLPLEPASVSQNASLLSNVTDLFKAAKQPPSSIGSASSSSVNLTNPLLNHRPTSPANSTV